MDDALQSIAIRRLRLLPAGAGESPAGAAGSVGNVRADTDLARLVVLSELAALGYLVTNPDDYDHTLLASYHTVTIPTLVALRGGDVDYAPLFDGFPSRLPDDDSILMRIAFAQMKLAFGWADNAVDALDHRDLGWWPASSIPQDPDAHASAVDRQRRLEPDTRTEWVEMTIAPVAEVEQRLRAWLTDTLHAPTSIKDAERDDVAVLLAAFGLDNIDLDRITLRETRSLVLHELWSLNALDTIVAARPTPTDLLRLFATATDTDASLATPIRFPRFDKRQRRAVLACLDATATAIDDDLLTHRGLWLRIGEYLHPGTYRNRYPTAAARFDHLRTNRRNPTSYNATAERFLAGRPRPTIELVDHLRRRPAVFARRLRTVLAGADPADTYHVLTAFESVAAKVPVKALLTLRVHLDTVDDHPTRAIVTKAGRIRAIPAPDAPVDGDTLGRAIAICDQAIDQTLGRLPSWTGDRVWIDPCLAHYVAPLQQRTVSDGMLNVARGTRLPLDQSPVLRLFVYWHDGSERTDLDLSVTMLGDDFTSRGHVDWTRLRGQGIVHSGDLTSAPAGATELIDITLRDLPSDAAYVVPQIHRYAGSTFRALPRAHAGWMSRRRVDADHQSFDIKTVQNVFDLLGAGAYAVPFVADLRSDHIIYTDLFVGGRQLYNTAATHASSISDLAREISRFTTARLTLDQLATYNARARGAAIVAERSDANRTIGVDADCDLVATDVTRINADLLT